MSGGQHDQEPEVDLPALNPDQRSGVTCINCGAQRSFRRVRGCHQMPELVAAIDRAINPATPRDYAEVA